MSLRGKGCGLVPVFCSGTRRPFRRLCGAQRQGVFAEAALFSDAVRRGGGKFGKKRLEALPGSASCVFFKRPPSGSPFPERCHRVSLCLAEGALLCLPGSLTLRTLPAFDARRSGNVPSLHAPAQYGRAAKASRHELTSRPSLCIGRQGRGIFFFGVLGRGRRKRGEGTPFFSRAFVRQRKNGGSCFSRSSRQRGGSRAEVVPGALGRRRENGGGSRFPGIFGRESEVMEVVFPGTQKRPDGEPSGRLKPQR